MACSTVPQPNVPPHHHHIHHREKSDWIEMQMEGWGFQKLKMNSAMTQAVG